MLGTAASVPWGYRARVGTGTWLVFPASAVDKNETCIVFSDSFKINKYDRSPLKKSKWSNEDGALHQ